MQKVSEQNESTGGKEALFSKLLSPTLPQQSTRVLIQEIDGENGEEDIIDDPIVEGPEGNSDPRQEIDEGPTIMEMMMAAQKEAADVKKKEKAAKEAEEAKKFGNGTGFKKGFFGGSGSKSKKVLKPKEPAPKSESDVPIVLTKKKQDNKVDKVYEEVQQAMKEDENPMLKQLRSNEWVTPDLMDSFKTNPTLANGFSNPKCLAAIQLMTTNPKEAMKKFQNDPEVSQFLQEFGKIMGSHFSKLGNPAPEATKQKENKVLIQEVTSSKTSSSSGSSSSSSSGGIGPLHAKVLEDSQNKKTGLSGNGGPGTVLGTNNMDSDASDERVQEVLGDADLREMLMDQELQRILMECGDPVKFRKHMSNPQTAKKIKKLYDAGLVGTAK